MTEQTNSQGSQLPAKRSPIPPAPIHPLAALSTLVLDGVFGVIEIIDPLTILFVSVGVGVLNAITTTLVQHYLAKDEWGPSVAKGMVMGIIAGVPYAVAGTAVGIPLLGWAGLHEWVKFPGRSKKTPELPGSGSDEIIEADVKDIEEDQK